MSAYYNEHDAYAAAWLRNLISAGLIAPGDVDERSIADVRPSDLSDYDQCHFFAGVGGWSLALRLAGWPDDRPVWTGSCPCQPFSAAGAGKAADDARHLWPVWFPLIAECRPAIVFGEQVEAAIGWGWLDAVFADLEAEGYACGATVLPACGVGAPHIRQRVWFVADAARGGRGEQPAEHAQDGGGTDRHADRSGGSGRMAHPDGGHASAEGLQRGGQHGQRAQDGGIGRVAHAERPERRPHDEQHEQASGRQQASGGASGARAGGLRLGDAGSARLARRPSEPGDDGAQRPPAQRASRDAGAWADCDWLPCTDGKARPVEPGTFPLAHGIPGRVGRLRAYGNAIVPQIAAEFVTAMAPELREGAET